ncbi:MAG: SelT/SelW/SelH family protein [Pseudomonadota bacterium]
MENRVEIVYCVGCRWLMRAAWMAQELLSTFEDDISTLSLTPGGGGVFTVSVNDQLIWCRKEKGGFPELKELKQLVRDAAAPDRNLGHCDYHPQQ